MSLYSSFYNVFNKLVRTFWRVTVEGEENIPDGGYILACNHTSMADTWVLSAAMGGRQIRYMAKKELFKIPVLKQLITALGAYPVDRGGADVSGIKTAISIIKGGEVLGIFPQGTRHPGVDPRETKVMGGVGMITCRAKADVLPAYIISEKNKTRAFRKNRVVFGPVIKFEELGIESRADYQRGADEIFRRVCALRYGETE